MDRTTTTPFMLRLFYRTAAFHRPDEFNVSSSADLPPHLTLHVWQDCTLTELSHYIAAASSSSSPRLLPDPGIGTRLVFRLIFSSLRGVGGGGPGGGGADGDGGRGSGSGAKFMVKDLGSVVIGEGGKGLDVSDLDDLDGLDVDDEVLAHGDGAVEHHKHGRRESQISRNGSNQGRHQPPLELGSDGSKTLSELRLVPGDYISCAILPPLEDGSVAPASSARSGRGAGTGEARASVGGMPPSGRDMYRGERGWDRNRHQDREDGYGRQGGTGGRGGIGGRDRGGGRGGGFGGRRDGGGFPTGEWRRGETLPTMSAEDWRRGDDGPPSRGRGRGKW